jgi:signal peptidase II
MMQIVILIAAALAIALDQFTKHVIVTSFAPGESRIFIPHLVYWTYVQNHAGAFGLFGTQPWLLVIMALIVLVLFWFAFRDSAERSRTVQIAFGAIAGGAIGNIIDRFHYGYVVDFIDFRWWPVFNAADSCITLGVCALILSTILRERAARAAA